jgi:hypothetical protein
MNGILSGGNNQESHQNSSTSVAGFTSSLEKGLIETRIVRGQARQIYIGKHLIAIAFVQNRKRDQAALVLEFESMHCNTKRCLISRGDLVGRGVKRIFESLLARGYYYEPKQRDALLGYLSGLGCELPEVIADEADRISMDINSLVFNPSSLPNY